MCFCSFSFPSELVGTVSADGLGVLITLLLLQCVLRSPRRADCHIYMLCEGFHFPSSDCDPGVLYIPEPVASSSSCEGNQGTALNFFHVEVVNYWGHWWAHGTAMPLSVETFTELEAGGRQTEFQQCLLLSGVRLVLLDKVLSCSRCFFTILTASWVGRYVKWCDIVRNLCFSWVHCCLSLLAG